MTAYTVRDDLTLNKFKLYLSSGYTSLSRTSDFENAKKQMNYPAGGYYDKYPQEAFADMVGIYLKYRSGAVTYNELESKHETFLIDYFDPIEKSGFKVSTSIAKSINDMPNPVNP